MVFRWKPNYFREVSLRKHGYRSFGHFAIALSSASPRVPPSTTKGQLRAHPFSPQISHRVVFIVSKLPSQEMGILPAEEKRGLQINIGLGSIYEQVSLDSLSVCLVLPTTASPHMSQDVFHHSKNNLTRVLSR